MSVDALQSQMPVKWRDHIDIIQLNLLFVEFWFFIYLCEVAICYDIWCDTIQYTGNVFIFNRIFDQLAKVVYVNPW